MDTPDGTGPDRERADRVEPPGGDAYDWLQRGLQLLAAGDAAAAATVLAHARQAEPTSAEVLEALARAQFDSGRFAAAAESFRQLTDGTPDSDYAHFGLGAALARLGVFAEAERHLALAAVMRPERREYGDRLRQVRATIAARREAELPPDLGQDPGDLVDVQLPESDRPSESSERGNRAGEEE